MSKKYPNVLFSTTNMWNCGDDFINLGVMSLLKSVIGRYNPILYNRHPALHLENNANWALDNSWDPAVGLSSIDYVVYSGPEWFGPKLAPLTEQLIHTNIPILFIGIGCGDFTKKLTMAQLSPGEQILIKKARYIAARDPYILELLQPYGAVLNPCPALFCADDQASPQQLKKIALCTQTNTGVQKLKSRSFEFTIALFNQLIRLFDCTIICHRVEELAYFARQNIPTRFSYDAKDYLQIYREYDLTVSTRVHGVGICASLGIPGYLIYHTRRCDTAKGFLSTFIPIKPDKLTEVVNNITQLNITEKSQQLIAHKQQAKKKYLSELAFLNQLHDAH